eukprot:TRINITY_DN1635_c0_g1_i1.p1 TRINITY_DN1635_c0_g1~~TRINITY_DN1635_c0_g1_i1.p1  ORF type:complete len:781 (-),score=191.71 TRINITY_DN1635_c0_g1_i1:71-2413(-)
MLLVCGLLAYLSNLSLSLQIVPVLKDGSPINNDECLNDQGQAVPCANPPNTCLHRADDYYQESSTNCAEYFRCVAGVAHAYKCPLGTLWSREANVCDWDFRVQCQEASEAAAAASIRYPGILSNYDYRQMTPESLLAESERLIKVMTKVYDSVGGVPRESVNFENVIKPLIDLDGDIHTQSGALTFSTNVALEKALRDASSEANKKITEVQIDLSLRKDVFLNIKQFSQTEEAKNLNYEQKRYVEETVRAGKRNGLLLAADDLEEFKKNKKRISELGIDFRKCLSEDTSHFYADEKDLSGVPADVIESMEKDERGKRKVTTKYTHYYPVIKKCKNPKTRYLMEKTKQTMCVEENTPRIEELITLRQKQATLLGYPTHAAFVLEEKMAKSPENVEKFLTDLSSKLQVLWKREKETMLGLKEAESKELGFDFDGTLAKEDFWYYVSEVEKNNYSVDKEKLKEYFPLETVTSGMMEIYQTLLGLKFTKLEGGEVWHDDVSQYQVDDKATGENIGYFYMDLHPRDGKYGHAAMWGLQPGSLDRFGNRQKAVATMVCNFPKSTAEKPALLEHRQVQTFFHEFGHVMHGICSRTNISTFFGTATEGDFVEAPSQMLENWVWEEESLKLMSGHFKDGSPIPTDLLKNLVASKAANEGGKSLRQMFFATYDFMVHTRGEADTVQLAKELYKELLGIERIEGTNIGANLGHLIGYDAGYYGYMWSLVFSQDMFDTRFAKEGILNPQTGMDYRNMILRPGGSQDGSEMLKNFLGREPNQEAFLKSKGLEL